MDWSNLRGKALETPKKEQLNFKILEYRIMYLVRQELKEFIKEVKIEDNNEFGKWVIL
jgi:hypothetical protein|tara:strand:- start:129 stop:302 length:174 start_codon:yes stop_codon:yes gene_type:complete